MTHASVFSGIGGPEVAAAMLGWDNLFHCEINEFGRKILDYWFPNSQSYEDITKTDFSEWRGRVDVLTGGFPCQPFSYAGKRKGADDDRYLWPYMFKAIDQIRPTWVVGENVAGITTMVEQGEVSEMEGQASIFQEVDGLHRYRLTETFTMQRICDDLEGHGYAVQPVLIPACGVGAPHRRDRVFIVANRQVMQRDGSEPGKRGRREEISELGDHNSKGISTSDTDRERLEERRQHGGRKMETQGTAGTDNRTERPCSERPTADTESEQGGRCELGQPQNDGQKQVEPGGRGGEDAAERTIANTDCSLLQRWDCKRSSDSKPRCRAKSFYNQKIQGRWSSFPTVSPVHRGNDGIPFDVDGLAIPFGKWRAESLKAYGNAIVPQVMYEIFRAIDIITTKTMEQ